MAHMLTSADFARLDLAAYFPPPSGDVSGVASSEHDERVLPVHRALDHTARGVA